MIFSRNNLFPPKVTLEYTMSVHILCHPLKVWALVMYSVNVSAHYFRERVEISCVGLAGALLRLRNALQSGETNVRTRYDTILHCSVLIAESLDRFNWSALGPKCASGWFSQTRSHIRSLM